jgi:glycerol-3-phosphate acyltransferase PlsY
VTIFLSVVVIVSGYLLGSIPVGLLVVRAMTGKDVRDVGSGRIGGANVMRAAGPWVALLTGLCDGAKGLLAVYLARAVVGIPAVEALAGLAAVAGHNYSIFIGFKGGAGTATTIGGAIGLWPWGGPILIVVGVAVVAITRYTSVGSITIALLLPVILALRAYLADAPWAYLIHGLGTAALTLWALRPNIRRLLAGNERRASLRKKA